MQGTLKINIPALLRFHVPGATKALVSQLLKSMHSRPGSHSYWAYVLQLLELSCLESGLHNKRGCKRSFSTTRSPHTVPKSSPCSPQLEKSPRTATKTQHNQKINKDKEPWDSPGGSVAKVPCSQSKGTWVRSLVRELDPTWGNWRSCMPQLKPGIVK